MRSTLRQQPIASQVYDTYWQFAAKRQEIFHRRVRGETAPWTDDPVLSNHRFTNPYRAADRVSQYLIRHVAYSGSQEPEEIIFRVLLFKLFNRISTWELLSKSVGPLTTFEFDVKRYDQVLSRALERGERVYSAAYIMPAASPNAIRKHQTHLELLRIVLDKCFLKRLLDTQSMKEAFLLLQSIRGIGTFLAYQLVTDLNYTSVFNFSEMEFVMAGPGSRSGIKKCFADTGNYSDEDIIRYVVDRQAEEFSTRNLAFQDLWGRPLQLIDCQNLFCEVDKYARLVHPEVKGIGERTRIKQKFSPMPDQLEVWFPPKWEINSKLPKPKN